MKKENAITLISLVVTIIILIILAGITINIVLGDNGIITKAKEAKTKQEIAEIKEKLGLDILDAQMEAMKRSENLEQEQLEDIISKYGQLQEDKDTIILKDDKGTLSLLDIYKGTTVTEGSYSENKAKIELLESQVATLQKQLDDASKNSTEATQELLELRETLSKVTVTEATILKDYTAYKDGKLITGTMINNGAVEKTLNAGETYSIPIGYHDGSGKVTANSLENQTSATATASDIASGKTAYVNGELVTGTVIPSKGLESSITRQYSTYISIWDYGGEADKQVGSYTASKDGKVIVNFIGINHKITGGNATVNQKLYRNGSVISTGNYNSVLDLKAGETIRSTITLKFERSSSSSYFGVYTAAMVITETT